MDSSVFAPEGMVVTPHHLASQSALTILKEGGTAIDATVAAAATLAVVYPHMNSIGGDSFWLILPPNSEPLVINACGAAGSLASRDLFAGEENIPFKGPKSALTVAGTVGGWDEALKFVVECGFDMIPVKRLLTDSIKYANNGYPVTESQINNLKEFIETNDINNEFKSVFLRDEKLPKVGDWFYQPALGSTLERLSDEGLDSFYRGNVAKDIKKDIEKLGMPIVEADLANYYPERRKPLKLKHTKGDVFNLPPPTQGLVSLAILGILDNLNVNGENEGRFIHYVVEATKQAFKMRNANITDPNYMTVCPETLISPNYISQMARNITEEASNVGKGKGPGDTVWMGVMDSKGFSVSFIQSIYHPFGSGVILPSTGILWHNRGVSFSLDENNINVLVPGKKPYHTLNPAAARLNDGRVFIYGTRGGDGQPQTQAAIFHRYVIQDLPLQQCLNDPRWVYGRTVGRNNDLLRLEDRFSEDCVNDLKNRGHNIVMLSKYSEEVGHAGALVRHRNGMLEGAYDPRSDGNAIGF